MVLHTCDKCIFSKSKWSIAVGMASQASKHMNLKNIPQQDIAVVLETEDGNMDCNLKDMTKFGKPIVFFKFLHF